jgi:hypothetical protein
MYSTIEEAWGEQPILTIPNHEILYNKNKCNDNTNNNADTNADTSVNTNANTNTNTNTNTNSIAKTIDNTILNKSKEPFINNSKQIYEENEYKKCNKKIKNNNIIQSFLIGFLVIFILQLINNKFINNSIKNN